MDTNIVSALITASATILAAFIAKGYVERRVETTSPTKPLDRPTATILHLLSSLSVKSAQVIRIQEDQVYVSDDLGFSLVATGIYPALGFADTTINIFGDAPREFKFKRGEVISYQSTTCLLYTSPSPRD